MRLVIIFITTFGLIEFSIPLSFLFPLCHPPPLFPILLRSIKLLLLLLQTSFSLVKGINTFHCPKITMHLTHFKTNRGTQRLQVNFLFKQCGHWPGRRQLGQSETSQDSAWQRFARLSPVCKFKEIVPGDVMMNKRLQCTVHVRVNQLCAPPPPPQLSAEF